MLAYIAQGCNLMNMRIETNISGVRRRCDLLTTVDTGKQNKIYMLVHKILGVAMSTQTTPSGEQRKLQNTFSWAISSTSIQKIMQVTKKLRPLRG